MDFYELAADGRIRRVVGFFGGPPEIPRCQTLFSIAQPNVVFTDRLERRLTSAVRSYPRNPRVDHLARARRARAGTEPTVGSHEDRDSASYGQHASTEEQAPVEADHPGVRLKPGKQGEPWENRPGADQSPTYNRRDSLPHMLAPVFGRTLKERYVFVGMSSVIPVPLAWRRIHSAILSDLTLTRRRARRRLGAEERLVIEEADDLAVLPAVGEAEGRAGLRIVAHRRR